MRALTRHTLKPDLQPGPKPPLKHSITLRSIDVDAADALAELRVAAMRESLEAVGRFDAKRARMRFLDSFEPQFTREILDGDERVGFVVVKPAGQRLKVDHFYITPAAQGRGIGSQVLRLVLAEADAANAVLELGALRASRSNAFYLRHGFRRVRSSEFDIHYERLPT